MHTMGMGMGELLQRAGPVEMNSQMNPMPWRGGALLAETVCEAVWKEFRTLAAATAVYSNDTLTYDAYGGVDLEPDHAPWPYDETRRTEAAGIPYGDWNASSAAGALVPGPNTWLTGGRRVQAGECTAAAPGGGVWYTQRIGPFVSTGGYNWWALSWKDPAFMSKAFEGGAKTKAGILAHFSGPVNAEGTEAIGYPPIHQHHVHIVPSENDIAVLPYGDFAALRLLTIHGVRSLEGMNRKAPSCRAHHGEPHHA